MFWLVHGGFWAINELPRHSFLWFFEKGVGWFGILYQLPCKRCESYLPTRLFLSLRYEVRIPSSFLFTTGTVPYLALWFFHLAFAARFDY